MVVLVTGGTGKTGLRLARFLQDAKIPFLLTSRKGSAGAPSETPTTKFDWLDSTTYNEPFVHESLGGEKISAVYLVGAQVSDPETAMIPFIDIAIKEHGVKRFVLLTGSTAEKYGRAGKLWQHLDNAGVEYCVLRATWFMGMCEVQSSK